jgi:molybdate transport system substrate-binding protein
MATGPLLAALARRYNAPSGPCIHVEWVGGVDAARRVRAGEAFDFVVLAAEVIDQLVVSGHVDAHGRIEVARSSLALAVRAGASVPDVRTEAALRDAILPARGVGCSTGPSGTHVMRLLERWGIAAEMAPRVVQAPPGVPVGTRVARGEVEPGFQQRSELIDMPDITCVTSLPPNVQADTVFSAGVCRTARHRDAAGAFLAFLASPEAEADKLRHGMASVPTGPAAARRSR